MTTGPPFRKQDCFRKWGVQSWKLCWAVSQLLVAGLSVLRAGFNLKSVHWHLWWTNGTGTRFAQSPSVFPPLVSFHHCCTLIFITCCYSKGINEQSLGTCQKAKFWKLGGALDGETVWPSVHHVGTTSATTVAVLCKFQMLSSNAKWQIVLLVLGSKYRRPQFHWPVTHFLRLFSFSHTCRPPDRARLATPNGRGFAAIFSSHHCSEIHEVTHWTNGN